MATAAVEYPTECKPFQASRNPHLEIEVGDEMAHVYCQDAEHVGEGRNRKVTFLANRDCTLEFKNGEMVFRNGEKTLALIAGEEETLYIKDGANGVETWCFVLPIDGTKVPPMEHNSPPRIVVP